MLGEKWLSVTEKREEASVLMELWRAVFRAHQMLVEHCKVRHRTRVICVVCFVGKFEK